MRSCTAWYVLLVLAASVLIPPAHAVRAQLSTESSSSSSSSSEKGDSSSQSGTRPVSSYFVLLKQQPVAGFEGDAGEGVEAVQVAGASKIDTKLAKVQAYAQYLDDEATATAHRAGVAGKVQYRFKYAMNGLAIADPTEQELQQLSNDSNVRSIVKDELKVSFTFGTPRFLGLAGYEPNGVGGAWDQAGWKTAGGAAEAGYNVIIGVVDTGIWVENTCFSDRKGGEPQGAFDYGKLPKRIVYNGKCPIGPRKHRVKCNRKVIGCQYFNQALGGEEYVKKNFPDEYNNCRDASGHGSHVAAITAGNYGYSKQFGQEASGMAPRARLAIYKALWGSTGDSGSSSGSTIDIVAAIDKAVEDGVDILNLSLGSQLPTVTFRDVLQEAMMQAARAGVFVSVAAGNSGPDAGTVDHPAPWITTVAAARHDRTLMAPVELGNGKTLLGGGTHTDVVGPAALVLANLVALKNKTNAQLCKANSLNAEKVAGKIVVCDRGDIPRVLKSQEVKRAGGVGMILLDVEATGAQSGEVAELHAVPAVHLPQKVRDDVRAYAARGGATATIYGAILREAPVAPQMANFSSRGPALAGGGVVLKPDIAAPGADIFSAYSPQGRKSGLLYQYNSGTSMASPHIAGIAALLRQMNPTWSPMMIKSALMTTAYTETLTGQPGESFGNAFDYGAGHVNPRKMFNPGLVFDSKYKDWQLFLCGASRQDGDEFCQQCDSDPDLCQPYNLNAPSIALPYLFGTTPVTVRRTVTSVMPKHVRARFSASSDVDKSSHLKITVSPSSFSIEPDKTQQVSITIQAQAGVLINTYVFGSVKFEGPDDIIVRIPVVARVLGA